MWRIPNFIFGYPSWCIGMIIRRVSLEIKRTLRMEKCVMGVFNVHVALFYIDWTVQITGGYVNDLFGYPNNLRDPSSQGILCHQPLH